MKTSRNITNIIRYVLDNMVPPILRDQKWFIWIPFKLLFKDKIHIFLNFKDNLSTLTDKEIKQIYETTKNVHISRLTDINLGCLKKIELEVSGTSVLDVGCGSGHLTNILEKTHKVTSLDFVKSLDYHPVNKSTIFVEADASTLPFEDNSFDTVICAHTLEHIKDIKKAIKELQRVCKKKLVIVVPKQRPYRYTFDLHIHFFPYEHTFMDLMSTFNKCTVSDFISTIQGDIYYHEEYEDKA
ncbi:Methyltransferase type 11 [hydrothermal vent metagenome]|uniref:Methyltransferase type 11 n=1 Tax=hydrothermal vent metagenome TaxID=652676 RepID=A0A3B0WIK2_9ZZZZ